MYIGCFVRWDQVDCFFMRMETDSLRKFSRYPFPCWVIFTLLLHLFTKFFLLYTYRSLECFVPSSRSNQLSHHLLFWCPSMMEYKKSYPNRPSDITLSSIDREKRSILTKICVSTKMVPQQSIRVTWWSLCGFQSNKMTTTTTRTSKLIRPQTVWTLNIFIEKKKHLHHFILHT